MLQQQAAPSSANQYNLNTEVRLFASFFVENTDVAADPTEIVLYLLDPAGAQTEYTYAAADIVRTAVGQYYFTWLTSLAGTWLYKWQGLGSLVVMSRDIQVVVRPSKFNLQLVVVPPAASLTFTGLAPSVTI
jgi:hypothetical protein